MDRGDSFMMWMVVGGFMAFVTVALVLALTIK